MDDARLPTDFLIQAQIRIAARDGVPVTIVHHGDNSSGTIILKINLLNGNARVLSQVRYADELVWSPVSRKDPMSDAEAEQYMSKQINIDPDAWLVEIEDRHGRHYFPGRVMLF